MKCKSRQEICYCIFWPRKKKYSTLNKRYLKSLKKSLLLVEMDFDFLFYRCQFCIKCVITR